MKRIAFALLSLPFAAPAGAQQNPEDFTFKVPEPQALPSPQFPRPRLVALDLCARESVEAAGCAYKCQGGAVENRPASDCPPYFTRQVEVTEKRLAREAVSPGELEALLGDPDPAVRRAAVISARNHVQNFAIQDRVLKIMKSASEYADIRVEAARSVSRAAGNSQVSGALRALAADARQPGALRVMAYKALWGAAAFDYGVQGFLQDAAAGREKNEAARLAAVWALFDVSRNAVAQDLLLGLMSDARNAETLRLEALKSVFSGAADFKVKPALLKTAADAAQPPALRLAAVKALSGIGYDYEARRLCERLAREDRDPAVRAEAAIALEPDYAELRDFFHLAYREGNNPYGLFVNPIDKE